MVGRQYTEIRMANMVKGITTTRPEGRGTSAKAMGERRGRKKGDEKKKR